jgi:hypothetical protein
LKAQLQTTRYRICYYSVYASGEKNAVITAGTKNSKSDGGDPDNGKPDAGHKEQSSTYAAEGRESIEDAKDDDVKIKHEEVSRVAENAGADDSEMVNDKSETDRRPAVNEQLADPEC